MAETRLIPTPARVVAFTLIELLIVILIILILAGLLLTGWQAMRKTLKKSETSAIMQIVQQALAMQASDNGALPPPAEHPFAGTKAPRLHFVGDRGAGWIDLEPAGEALAGVQASRIQPSDRDRLITGHDLFAEADAPAFYGVERRLMGIVGTPVAAFTRYLDLGRANVAQDRLPPPYEPFDPQLGESGGRLGYDFDYETEDPPHYPAMHTGNPRYPRDLCLVEGIKSLPAARVESRYWGVRGAMYRVLTRPDDNHQLISWLFPANLQEELRQLGGLRQPPDDDQLLLSGPPTPAGKVGQAEEVEVSKVNWHTEAKVMTGYTDAAAIDDNPRVWSDDDGQDRWEPGRIRVSDRNTFGGTGKWYTYMLRGPAIYDAWGREILYTTNDAGGFNLLSAGQDGCFAIVPGQVEANGSSIFDTDVSNGYDGVPQGQDRDGTVDNVMLGK